MGHTQKTLFLQKAYGMKRSFNTTGSCNPALHYMVDMSNKLEQIEELIDEGKYFTITRARQFGKTTTLDMLYNRLSDRYIVVQISFEGEFSMFDSTEAFCEGFDFKVSNAIGMTDDQSSYWLNDNKSRTLDGLSAKIKSFCER